RRIVKDDVRRYAPRPRQSKSHATQHFEQFRIDSECDLFLDPSTLSRRRRLYFTIEGAGALAFEECGAASGEGDDRIWVTVAPQQALLDQLLDVTAHRCSRLVLEQAERRQRVVARLNEFLRRPSDENIGHVSDPPPFLDTGNARQNLLGNDRR